MNGRAGRTAADDAAALQHVEHQRYDPGALVGVDEAPLPAAAEPDARRLLECVERLLALDVLDRPALEDGDLGGPGLAERRRDAVAVGQRVGVGGRQHDDLRLLPARQFHELVDHPPRHAAPADDDQRPLLDHGNADLGGRESLGAITRGAAQRRQVLRPAPGQRDPPRLAPAGRRQVQAHLAHGAKQPAIDDQRRPRRDLVTDLGLIGLEEDRQGAAGVLGEALDDGVGEQLADQFHAGARAADGPPIRRRQRPPDQPLLAAEHPHAGGLLDRRRQVLARIDGQHLHARGLVVAEAGLERLGELPGARRRVHVGQDRDVRLVLAGPVEEHARGERAFLPRAAQHQRPRNARGIDARPGCRFSLQLRARQTVQQGRLVLPVQLRR